MRACKERKTVPTVAVGVALLLVAIALPSCRNTERELQATKARIDRAISAFAAEHNAVQDWKEECRSGWTLEVEQALVRPDGRPILVRGIPVDIWKHEGNYFMRIAARSGLLAGTRMDLILECSEDHVAELMRRESESGYALRGLGWSLRALSRLVGGEYAVIAQVSSVRRAPFEIRAYGAKEYAEVAIEDADVLVAHGRCLDLRYFERAKAKGER